MPVLPSWLIEPLWDQFSALLPEYPRYGADHPLHYHRPRVDDRIVFDKLLQVLRFSCSYEAIADITCSATTIRNRRDEWIAVGIFDRLKQIVLACHDRLVGLVLAEVSVDGRITKASGGGEVAGPSPVDRRKQRNVVRVRFRLRADVDGDGVGSFSCTSRAKSRSTHPGTRSSVWLDRSCGSPWPGNIQELASVVPVARLSR